MTEMFGEAWSPMSVPDLAPDDDDEGGQCKEPFRRTQSRFGIAMTRTRDLLIPNLSVHH